MAWNETILKSVKSAELHPDQLTFFVDKKASEQMCIGLIKFLIACDILMRTKFYSKLGWIWCFLFNLPQNPLEGILKARKDSDGLQFHLPDQTNQKVGDKF
jgi:hypothetical protein